MGFCTTENMDVCLIDLCFLSSNALKLANMLTYLLCVALTYEPCHEVSNNVAF